MSNIYKPIYHWKALDKRNPMVYDTIVENKVKWDFWFTGSKNVSKDGIRWHNLAKIQSFFINQYTVGKLLARGIQRCMI